MKKKKKPGSKKRKRLDVPYVYEQKLNKYERKLKKAFEKEKKKIARTLRKYMR
jgi:hypothetical protein